LNQWANRDAALALASMDLHVFACNPDKTPCIEAWEQNATSSALKIQATWQPHLLPAIPVGAHHLLVIDADRKNGVDGVAAFTSLCAERAIELSTTLVAETPSGGFHFYWRTDVPYGNSRGSLPKGIDVRGVGGFCIAPGATLPDGRAYRIVQGSWDAIASLPDALAALLTEKRTQESPLEPVGTNMTDRERSYALSALNAECEKLAAMQPGSGRNAALNEAAHSMGTMNGWIERQTVFDALMDASARNGYIEKDGSTAARRTIESGYSAGQLKPRQLLSDVPNIDVRGLIAPKRGVTLISCASIEAKPVIWLWDGFIAKGKLTLLAGAGGTGKSTIAFNFAGIVSNGGCWPDGSRCVEPANVLIWSSEDDPADTIVPRLQAVGANVNRCHIVASTTEANGQKRSFDIAKDISELRSAAIQLGIVSLLIIDPIVSAVTGDMNKSNDVRRSLQSIVDFASEMNCAVVGITHFAKGTEGRNAADRVLGSTAFKDFSRSTLVAAKDDKSDSRVFAKAKSNNSSDTGGFNYSIELLRLNSGIEATRIAWGEPIEGSARTILAKVEGDGNEGGAKLSAAKQFLIEVLKSGPAPAKEVLSNAREGFGITEDTLRRAYREIGARPSKVGFGSSGGWMWSLPF
jgi:hypothetical protein